MRLEDLHNVDFPKILEKMSIKDKAYQAAKKTDRKQRSTNIDYVKATFAYRFSCCTCDFSLDELSKKLELSKTALFEYRWGQSEPRLTAISRIAGEFNVSTDYLLGLTDTKSIDPTQKSASEYTGLSDEAVARLHHHYGNKEQPLYSKIVSHLIESGALDNLVALLEKSLILQEQQSLLFDANDEQRRNTLETQEYQFNKQISGLYTTVINELSKKHSGDITYIAKQRFLDLIDGAMDTKEKMDEILDVARSDEKIWAAFIQRRASRE